MAYKETIDHVGVVRKVDDFTVEVVIKATSACNYCSAKKSCGITDSAEKALTVARPPFDIAVGDYVNVEATTKQGLYAVIIAYVIPAVLIIITVVSGNYAGMKENRAAILAILILIPYFLIIYLLRNKIGNGFKLTITKKINNPDL